MKSNWAAIIFFTMLLIVNGGILAFKSYDDFSGEAEYNGLREIAFKMSGIKMKPADSNTSECSLPTIDEGKLSAINPDYAAWLYIPGMPINYPVVTAEDNQTYLKKTFEGKAHSCGSLFFDSALEPFSSLNMVIHGHNMRSGNMFGRLKDYLTMGFGESHKTLYLFKQGEWTEYQLFAVYLVQEMDITPYQYLFATQDDFSDYVKMCQSKSIYAAGLDVTKEEEILTLSTCYGRSEKLILQWKPAPLVRKLF